MPATVTGPKCHRSMPVPDHLAGKQVRCPGCAQAFVVPTGNDGAPAFAGIDREGQPGKQGKIPIRARRRDGGNVLITVFWLLVLAAVLVQLATELLIFAAASRGNYVSAEAALAQRVGGIGWIIVAYATARAMEAIVGRKSER